MVAPGLKGGPPDVGLITLGLNILRPSWFAVYLSPLICVLEADPGNQHFQVFCPWTPMVQPNKWDQKGEGRNVNEKVCLPYQQTKYAVPSSHQPLPTLISALRRNLSVVGVGNASHCSVLTWKIPWREECGGLQFMASHRAGYDWACMTEHRLWDLRSTNPGPQLWKYQVPATRLPGISYHILRCQLPGCKLCQSTSLYALDARDWIINILITKKKWELCDGMELVNALVGIILPYITVSNQHAAHPKLAQCYMSILSL